MKKTATAAKTTKTIVTKTVIENSVPVSKYTRLAQTPVTCEPFVGNLGKINFDSACVTKFGTKPRVKFGVAVHDADGKTTWRNTTLFGVDATEFNARFKMGEYVAVTGKTYHEKWVNNETGEINEGDVVYDIFIEHKQHKSRVGI